MITQDQGEVVEFLAAPSTHGGALVERLETHTSMVFLAGTAAWKLKRAVRYDYLDFSTLERRKAMCEAEVRINRRTAPALYQGVAAVTREANGSLAIAGRGTPVEWLVLMTRFDQDGLFDRLAAAGRLDAGVMQPLASAIASFHRDAERRFDHGGETGMRWIVEGNAAGFAEQGAGVLDAAVCADVNTAARRVLGQQCGLLDARRAAGFVRQCHGDLHLRNIVLVDGRPTLFDAIEFNDRLACIDVLYDLAFVLMDLWRRRLARHANLLWNAYVFETGDFGGTRLLPLFLSCRAAVRAKTSATALALQEDPQRRRELQAVAQEYLAMARDLLGPPQPCLVAVGGISGSGKSTLAQALAAHLGAVPGATVIRSDTIRKQLFGVEPLVTLGSEAYTSDVSRRVYETAGDRAGITVRGGHAAVVDAVFGSVEEREAIERVAADTGVPFVGLWLDAPASVLTARAASRRNDPSDAGATVVQKQLAGGAGAIHWHHIDAAMAPGETHRRAAALLDRFLTARPS